MQLENGKNIMKNNARMLEGSKGIVCKTIKSWVRIPLRAQNGDMDRVFKAGGCNPSIRGLKSLYLLHPDVAQLVSADVLYT